MYSSKKERNEFLPKSIRHPYWRLHRSVLRGVLLCCQAALSTCKQKVYSSTWKLRDLQYSFPDIFSWRSICLSLRVCDTAAISGDRPLNRVQQWSAKADTTSVGCDTRQARKSERHLKLCRWCRSLYYLFKSTEGNRHVFVTCLHF